MSDTSANLNTSGNAIAAGGEARWSDYFALLKPRVMSLVIFTSLVGLMVAPGSIHGISAVAALIAIAVGAGASGALNMWYDADIDAEMQRTRRRPIPMGRISRDTALGFGLALSALSIVVLGFVANWMAAFLLAFTIAFYVLIYTMWLKRSTPQNIVIGGAAGALPPMIGWAAVTGSVGIESFSLFLIIFAWTPPHFWSLALNRAADYERVNVPMLPVVAGPDATRKQILIYSVLLVAISFLPNLLVFAGPLYAITAGLAGVVFLWLAWQVYTQRFGQLAQRSARRLFAFSIFYLFILFAALLVEHGAGLWTYGLPVGS